jgi:hypothetical protein
MWTLFLDALEQAIYAFFAFHCEEWMLAGEGWI